MQINIDQQPIYSTYLLARCLVEGSAKNENIHIWRVVNNILPTMSNLIKQAEDKAYFHLCSNNTRMMGGIFPDMVNLVIGGEHDRWTRNSTLYRDII